MGGLFNLFRDGVHERRGRKWSMPFAKSLTKQATRKTASHAGYGKIGRSLRCYASATLRQPF